MYVPSGTYPSAKTKNVLWAFILQKPYKVLSVKAWLLQYDERLNNMDYMRISSTESSSVILSQTKKLKKLERDITKVPKETEAIRDGE